MGEGKGKENAFPSSSSRRWSRPAGVTTPPRPRPATHGPISSEAPGIMNELLHTSQAAVPRVRTGTGAAQGLPKGPPHRVPQHRGRVLRAGRSDEAEKGPPLPVRAFLGPHKGFPAPSTPKHHKEHLNTRGKFLTFPERKRQMYSAVHIHTTYKIPENRLGASSAPCLALRINDSFWVKHHSNLRATK